MQISVRYTPDLMETFRLNLHLSRKGSWAFLALGVLSIIAAQVWPNYSVLFYILGIILSIEWPLLDLVRVYRDRQLIRQETEFTVTTEVIQVRVGSYTRRVSWEMVQRADELKDHWIFITKKPITRTPLRKRELSQEQLVELSAFIQARHLNKRIRNGMTPVAKG